MRKIILCIAVLFAQLLSAQITLIPFTPDIGFTQFTHAIDVYTNEIVAFSSYSHDLTQSRVFVFEKNGATITQETYFTPSDMALNDNFGGSVSIDHDFIAASSKYNDQVASDAGAVYMYRKVAGNWTFFQKVTAADGAANDYFGGQVEVVGNQLLVFAPNNHPTGEPSTNKGTIYVYKFNGATWSFFQKITMIGTAGISGKFELDGNRMILQSSDFKTYEYDGNNWNYSSSLAQPTTYNMDFKLDSNQLFVLHGDGFTSSMDVYDNVASNWSLNTTLTSLQYIDKVATNFEVHNNLMLISLNFHALLYTARTPTAIYRKIAGSWTFQEYVYGQGPTDRDDAFGTQMAITDDIVVLGAPYEYLPTAEGGRGYAVDLALGVNENGVNTIELYPNPTANEILLTGSLSYNIKTIDIFQFDGKLIKTIEYSQNPISLNEFQNGVYLLKFTMNNGSSTTKKIVKI